MRFLWLTADLPELSDKAKILFQNINNAVYLSAVEIAIETDEQAALEFIKEQKITEIFNAHN